MASSTKTYKGSIPFSHLRQPHLLTNMILPNFIIFPQAGGKLPSGCHCKWPPLRGFTLVYALHNRQAYINVNVSISKQTVSTNHICNVDTAFANKISHVDTVSTTQLKPIFSLIFHTILTHLFQSLVYLFAGSLIMQYVAVQLY